MSSRGSSHTAEAAALTELILETFRLNGRLLAAGDRLTAPLGLTSARWQVLGAIASAPITVAQIARNMGLTRQSVQRTVDRLCDEGLVVKRQNPSHRRARLVGLSAAGRQRLVAASRGQASWSNRLSSGLSPRDLRVTLRTLRSVRKRIEGSELEIG